MTRRSIAALLLLVALVVLPRLVTDGYFRSVIVECGIYAIFAVSLDLIVGFLGIYSFGHAAFFGVGAYVTAILIWKFQLSFWITIPAAILVSGLLGLLFAVPALRVRGIYFAITTLACAEIVRLVVVNFPNLTRGFMGLSVPRPTTPLGLDVDGSLVFYYLTYAFLILICVAIVRFNESAMGRTLTAIRENEQLASSIGVPILKTTVGVFFASSGVAGLAGAIYAGFIGIASPELLSVNYSALALLMVIVGGKGTVYGAIGGAFIFTVVSEFFRIADEWRMILFSLLLMVSMVLMPRGVIAPLIRGLARMTGAIGPSYRGGRPNLPQQKPGHSR